MKKYHKKLQPFSDSRKFMRVVCEFRSGDDVLQRSASGLMNETITLSVSFMYHVTGHEILVKYLCLTKRCK